MKGQKGILPGKLIFGVFEILFIVWIATRTVIGTLALIICVLSIIAIIVIPYKIRNRARPVVFETKKKKLYPELDDRDINKTRYPLTISDEYAEKDDMMPGNGRYSGEPVKILPAEQGTDQYQLHKLRG